MTFLRGFVVFGYENAHFEPRQGVGGRENGRFGHRVGVGGRENVRFGHRVGVGGRENGRFGPRKVFGSMKMAVFRVPKRVGVGKTTVFTQEAAEPPMISSNSLVMACWRVLLYCNVSSWMRSFALSFAVCMAIMRAACSEVAVSSIVV